MRPCFLSTAVEHYGLNMSAWTHIYILYGISFFFSPQNEDWASPVFKLDTHSVCAHGFSGISGSTWPPTLSCSLKTSALWWWRKTARARITTSTDRTSSRATSSVSRQASIKRLAVIHTCQCDVVFSLTQEYSTAGRVYKYLVVLCVCVRERRTRFTLIGTPVHVYAVIQSEKSCGISTMH